MGFEEVTTQNELGWQYLYRQQWPEAISIFEKVLVWAPDHEKALEGISTALIQIKDHERALNRIHRSLEIEVTGEKLAIAGYAFMMVDKVIEAVAYLTQACERIEAKPHWRDWLANCRQMFQSKFKIIAADNLLQIQDRYPDKRLEPLELHPNAPLIKYKKKFISVKEAHTITARLINQVKRRGDLARTDSDTYELYRLLSCCARLKPNGEVYTDLGVTSTLLGRLDEALHIHLLCLWKWPTNTTFLINFGSALTNAGGGSAATWILRLGALLQPRSKAAWTSLAAALCQERKNPIEAERAARKSILLAPEEKALNVNLSFALREQGRVPEAVECLERAIDNNFDSRVHSSLLLTYLYLPGADQKYVADLHVRSGAEIERSVKHRYRHEGPINLDAKIKIGFISADLIKHPVAAFIEPWWSNVNRSAFEIHVFSNTIRQDEVTKRLATYADQWTVVAGKPDQVLAKKIFDDGIAILFDLSGHTAGHRLRVFAEKPAPIQITYLGYPHTTGLSTIDYLLTGSMPANVNSGGYYQEELLELPFAHAYQPFVQNLSEALDPKYIVRDTPAKFNGHITFGCCNNFAKVNDEVIRVWSAILHQVDRSVLLVEAVGLDNDEFKEFVIRKFEQHGVGRSRLRLLPRKPEHQYVLYHQIDIALDPFPYNGGTTNIDLLWMGVPLVTLEGEFGMARAGAAFLRGLSRDNWIAQSENEYINIASNLASDINLLDSLRKKLWQDFKTSCWSDGKEFTRHVENKLIATVEKYNRGLIHKKPSTTSLP